MGAGAAAPTGVGSSPAPIVAPPVSTPIAPVITPTATPAPIKLFPKAGDPQGGKGGNPTAPAPVTPATDPYAAYLANVNGTTAGTPPAPTAPQQSGIFSQRLNGGYQPMAPTAPQQPQYNPFMQTYGQNNTPQQQMFNRFPQRFQQPQPVAQFAQGPVYADQSLNAPGNQPQQYSGQPQYGRSGRGFMPQNRGGYDRQMDQLRGGYNGPMPQIMPQQDGGYGGGYGQQATRYISPEERNSMEAYYRQDGINQANRLSRSFNMDRGQQQSPSNAIVGMSRDEMMRRYDAAKANQVNNPSGQQQMPAYKGPTQAQWEQMKNQPATGYAAAPSLGGQAPAGGKGGNPTAQLPPPPNQDGTPGSWSTYI